MALQIRVLTLSAVFISQQNEQQPRPIVSGHTATPSPSSTASLPPANSTLSRTPIYSSFVWLWVSEEE